MLNDAINQALGDIAALREADDLTVLATTWVWNLRDEGIHSTENMNDEELCQAFVEDLLTLHDFRNNGRMLALKMNEITRFLPTESKHRLAEVLEDHSHIKSLYHVTPRGIVELRPESLMDAMDFAGVWLEGYDPPEDEVVYSAGPLPS